MPDQGHNEGLPTAVMEQPTPAVSRGDGPEDLGGPVVSNPDQQKQSNLGSTSTVPNGFMTEHPGESLAGRLNSVSNGSVTEPDSPEGALDPGSPTTEPVSEPPPVVEADEHAVQAVAQPEAVAGAVNGAAPLGGMEAGPTPVVSAGGPSPIEAPAGGASSGSATMEGGGPSPVGNQEVVAPVGGAPMPVEAAAKQGLTPRSNAAPLTPEQAQSQDSKIPGPSFVERVKAKLHLNIGTPAPPQLPPKPIS